MSANIGNRNIGARNQRRIEHERRIVLELARRRRVSIIGERVIAQNYSARVTGRLKTVGVRTETQHAMRDKATQFRKRV